MKLVSLNVGNRKDLTGGEKTICISIFKNPVTDQRKISFLNIEGDQQSDLSVHGSISKAVYAHDLSNLNTRKFYTEQTGRTGCSM